MNPGDLLVGIISGVRRKWGILPKGDDGQVLSMVGEDVAWADPGAAAHPNLAAHDALGLATDAELSAHDHDSDYEAAGAVVAHAGAADPHTGYVLEDAVPGGELGGTYASPTVDATHSGSAHHDPVTVGTGLDVTGQLVELDLSEVAAGGELGGFMDAPTVDATHSGSTHAATQAAAEATAAAALSGHAAAGDPHAGYRLESVPIAAADVAADVATQAELDAHTGATHAPTNADYLVGTAHADLSNEIAVGATPGGELGGTWASPTVDATHSGSTHAAAQAAAEATAADALATHVAAADSHTGYQREAVPTVTAPAQSLGTSEAYVTGSAIDLVTGVTGLRVGSVLRWRIFISKTNAGTAAPVIRIRFGTNGSAADTERIALTGRAQTAVVDSGMFEIQALVTAIGATGNVLGIVTLIHELGATGLSIGNWGQQTLSGNFDLTVAGLKAGITINAGASSAWTVNRLIKELIL